MRQSIFFFFIAFLFHSCGTSTSMSGSWTAPGIQTREFNKVAIMAMVADDGRRRMVESELVSAFAKRGIKAEPAYAIFPAGFLENKNKPSKEQIHKALIDASADALLTVALLDVKEETYYVPGSTRYSPYSHYGYWPGYYGYYSPYVYDPGYYQQSTNYFLVTNLYDVQGEELLWSGQSRTIDPNNLADFSNSYSGRVVGELKKQKVLK